MNAVSYILWFSLGIWLGHQLKRLKTALSRLQEQLKPKPKEEPEEEKSTIIDPDDPVQQARFEHEEMMRKLNPNENTEQ